MVLDMQARLLLDMLGRGIESALINSSALVPELWQASSETLSNIDPETMAVEPALIPSVQVCFGYSMESCAFLIFLLIYKIYKMQFAVLHRWSLSFSILLIYTFFSLPIA